VGPLTRGNRIKPTISWLIEGQMPETQALPRFFGGTSAMTQGIAGFSDPAVPEPGSLVNLMERPVPGLRKLRKLGAGGDGAGS
jgi:hypothetical protein